MALLPFLALDYLRDASMSAGFGGGVDFQKFYLSGQRVAAGLSPYWTMPGRRAGEECSRDNSASEARQHPREGLEPAACTHPNLNPPPFAGIAIVLARLPTGLAWWFWCFGSMIAGLLALRVLGRATFDGRGAGPLRFSALVAVFFAYFPVQVNFELGQVVMPLLLLTILAWHSMRRGNTARAGAWLGVAAALKPFFLLFLVALLALRARRALLAFCLASGTMFAMGAALVGIDAYRDYVRIVSDVSWTSTSWNASLDGFFARILGGAEAEPLYRAERLARGLTIAASLLVIWLMSSTLAVQPHGDPARRADAMFAATLPAMLLVSPLGWMYYFPLLIPTAWVLWRLGRESPRARLALGGAILPTCVPTGLSSGFGNDAPAFEALWSGALYFYCLLTVFIISRALLIPSQPETGSRGAFDPRCA